MKHEDELPEAARSAFDSYPRIEPSAAFNRAVLESLANAQANRRRGLVGKIEEFLGVGLWSFAASGALGAFVPMAILGLLVFSSPSDTKSQRPIPPTFPLHYSPYAGPLYARELEDMRSLYL